MKKDFCIFSWIPNLFYFLFLSGIILGCSNDDINPSPEVPFDMEFNASEYSNGDSLYGKVIIDEANMTVGTKIKKIDCRLGNIVIGTVEDKMVCPFGVRLKDKPQGIHTFSVIIKCETPEFDETFWRYDYKNVTIK